MTTQIDQPQAGKNPSCIAENFAALGSMDAWSKVIVQTCVVHLIRAANWFVSYGDRKAVSAQLEHIYTAPSIESAAKALDDFEASSLGAKYPSAVATWRSA